MDPIPTHLRHSVDRRIEDAVRAVALVQGFVPLGKGLEILRARVLARALADLAAGRLERLA